MSQRFRLAFLGIDNPHGAAWRELLLHFAGELELTAIVPGFGGALTSLEERYAAVPRFDTVDALLAEGQFDGALLCLPNNENPAAAARLAAAGKHVLSEKPVAGCADDARAIADAVQQGGVAYQNGYMWRYDAAAERVRQMFLDGRFGKLISIETTYVTSDVRRRNPEHYLFDKQVSQSGYFNWLACHHLDLLFYLTGQRVVGVTARVGNFGAVETPVEDGGVALLDLESGGLVTLIGGYWIPRWTGESRWCFRGSERWVHWDPGRGGTSGALEIHGPQPQWFPMDENFELPPDTTPGYGGARGVALVRDWLDAIESGNRPCRNTPQSTIATLELIDTIYQASAENRRIECSIG